MAEAFLKARRWLQRHAAERRVVTVRA